MEQLTRLSAVLVTGDPSFAESFRIRLELDDYDCLVVADAEALRAVKDRRPDLVFLDRRLAPRYAAGLLDQLLTDGGMAGAPVISLDLDSGRGRTNRLAYTLLVPLADTA